MVISVLVPRCHWDGGCCARVLGDLLVTERGAALWLLGGRCSVTAAISELSASALWGNGLGKMGGVD